jgi:RNA polymerase sigma factor (sigma-70 family)
MSHEPRTSGTLLRRTQRADDHSAWSELFDRYHPLLNRWTRARVGNRADVDEISQRIWCELIDRLPQFQYDRKRSFRAWLRRLHRHRLLDYLKQHRRYSAHLANFAQEVSDPILDPTPHTRSNASHSSAPLPCPANCTRATIDRALEIQQRVQQRTSEQTWAIFWQVTVENQALGDVARHYSMRYATAFAAVTRVHKMLREEALKLEELSR